MTRKQESPIWQVETCHTGGHLCAHQHRSRQAAARCLPTLHPSGRAYSMAAVVAVNAAARALDAAQEEETDARPL